MNKEEGLSLRFGQRLLSNSVEALSSLASSWLSWWRSDSRVRRWRLLLDESDLKYSIRRNLDPSQKILREKESLKSLKRLSYLGISTSIKSTTSSDSHEESGLFSTLITSVAPSPSALLNGFSSSSLSLLSLSLFSLFSLSFSCFCYFFKELGLVLDSFFFSSFSSFLIIISFLLPKTFSFVSKLWNSKSPKFWETSSLQLNNSFRGSACNRKGTCQTHLVSWVGGGSRKDF